MAFVLISLFALRLWVASGASYRPGIAPRTYRPNDDIPIRVDALSSTRTQIRVDHYKLDFCQPDSGVTMEAQSLGQYLEGSRIQSSPYRVTMAADSFCQKVCQIHFSQHQVDEMKWHISRAYHLNFMLDHLPAASIGFFGVEQYANGFPVGFTDPFGKFFVFNHLNFVIDFHKVDVGNGETGYQIVEFAIQPISIQHQFSGNYTWDGEDAEGASKSLSTCPYKKHLIAEDVAVDQELAPDKPVLFTYDVIWRDSEKQWGERWQVYLTNDNWVPMQIHWYSVSNSLVVVFLLSAMLVMVWVRANKPPSQDQPPPPRSLASALRLAWNSFRRNNNQYSSLSAQEDTPVQQEEQPDQAALEQAERLRQEERNWRRLHGDVFRPPATWPGLFCALIGTGCQLLVACFVVVLLAAFGYVSQAVPGTLPNAFLVSFNLSGAVAGFVSYRLFASFGAGPALLKRCVGMVALIFPGCVFASFAFLNATLSVRGSTSSLPFLDMLILFSGWAFGLIPMVLLGAYAASLAGTMEYPTHTNPVPRAIPALPPSKCWKHPFVGLVIAGILPFGALYVEVFFAMSSLWYRQYYYVFGVAFVVYMLALWTGAAASIIMVYSQLSFENHRWWWHSMCCGGSVGAYVGLYSFAYVRTLELDSSFATYAVYFIFMFWISVAMFLVFGSVGFLSTLFFMLKLYSILGPDQIDAEERSDESGYVMLDTMASSSVAEPGNEPGQQQAPVSTATARTPTDGI